MLPKVQGFLAGVRWMRMFSSLALVIVFLASIYAQPVIQPPSGFGNYCSRKNGSFGWGDGNSDPCGTAPESDIAYAGLWNMNGINRAYVDCDDGFATWIALPTAGDASIRAAFNATTGHGKCTINVAPKSMPIFRHPWLAIVNVTMRTIRGVDLALHGQTFTTAERCRSTGSMVQPVARELDNAGHVNWSATDEDSNHSGYDWKVDGNKPGDWGVRSVAAGRVVLARSRPISGSTNQNEVYIRYIVAKSLTSRYREEFIGYYAHLKSYSVSAGNNVDSGQLLGPVGDTGPGGTHLHLSVFRLRNVRGEWKSYATFGTGTLTSLTHDGNAESRTIDPFGWNDAACVDAWGYYADSTRGAPSINLWRSNLVPPGWNHAGHSD